MSSLLSHLKMHLKKVSAFSILLTGLIVALTAVLSNAVIKQHVGPEYGLLLEQQSSHDTLWHLALMSSIERSLQSGSLVPENPVFSGIPLKGYHFFNDLIWVLFHFLTSIPLIQVYLYVAPVALSLVFVVSSYWLIRTLTEDKVLQVSGTILLAVGSGLAAFAPAVFPEAARHQSLFWLDQPTHYYVNQQLLLSLSMMNIVLTLIFRHLQKDTFNFLSIQSFKKNAGFVAAVSLLFALLAITKVYAVLILVPAVLLGFSLRWIQRKNLLLFLAWLIGTISAVGLLLSNTGERGWPFILSPGWFFKSLFESGDRLNAGVWELERLVFAEAGNLPRLAIHWTYAAIVFYMGNFGVKILGLIAGLWLLAKRFFNKNIDVLFFFIAFSLFLATGAMAAPALFVQKGVIWNTIQFMHFAQSPLVVLLILFLKEITIKKIWKYSLLSSMVLLALPTTIISVYQQQTITAYFYANPMTVRTLHTLSSLANDREIIVDSSLAKTSLVPAVANRSVYYTDPIITEILELHTGQRHQNIFDQNSFCLENGVVASASGKPLSIKLEKHAYPLKQSTLADLPVTAEQVVITNCQ